jgi:hypothetical protein
MAGALKPQELAIHVFVNGGVAAATAGKGSVGKGLTKLRCALRCCRPPESGDDGSAQHVSLAAWVAHIAVGAL